MLMWGISFTIGVGGLICSAGWEFKPSRTFSRNLLKSMGPSRHLVLRASRGLGREILGWGMYSFIQ